MASSKENVLAQVFLAIGHGAGDTTLSDKSVDWLYDRYSNWLDTKTSENTTPLEVWSTHGPTFLKRFLAIGEAIGRRNPGLSPTGREGLAETVIEVEGQSDCPYCPSPNG